MTSSAPRRLPHASNDAPDGASTQPEPSDSVVASLSSFQDTPSHNEVVSLADRVLRDWFSAEGKTDDAAETVRHGTAYLTEQLGERYQIVEFLGAGAFGLVYRATDTKLGRDVAIKLPLRMYWSSTDLSQRVWEEARHAAALDHRSIVRVHEIVDNGTVPIIISAYCDGMTLDKWVANQMGGVPARQVASIGCIVADAIAHAHARGVLHRDIKPTNILVKVGDHRPEPMLMDFGLARRLSGGAKSPEGLCGTLRYMAPEVLASQGREESTASDVYSVGLVLWQLVTGRVPFEGIPKSDVDALRRAKLAALPHPQSALRDVPGNLRAVILKCIAPHPAARYQSGHDLKADLQRFLEHRPVLARKTTPARLMLAWCRRRPAMATLGGILGLVLLASIITVSWLYVRERRARALADERGFAMRTILQEMSRTLAGSRLVNVPQMDKIRIDLLEHSVAAYRELGGNDTKERNVRDLSVALHRLANAYSQTGRVAEARRFRNECLGLISKLRAIAPGNREYQYDEFMNLLLLGTEWRGTDRTKSAAVAEQACRIIRSLVAQNPDNEVYLDALTATLCDLAADLSMTGRKQDATKLLQEVVRRSQALWEAHPDHPLYRKYVARALEQMANNAFTEGDLPLAGQILEQAWAALEFLRRALPDERSFRSQEGNLLLRMAQVSLGEGDFKRADRQFLDCIETWSALARDYPDAFQIQAWIADANFWRSRALAKGGRIEEAKACYRNAVLRIQELVEEHPDNASFREQLKEFRSAGTLAGLRNPAPDKARR